MAKPSTLNFEMSSLFDNAAGQFRNLNPNEPGQWPTLPKAVAMAASAVLVVVVGWFLLLSATTDELDASKAQEPKLQADYVSRLKQAVNLSELRKQKLQVQEYVTQLEKQLPGKADMDDLLSDINQAGLGRGLLDTVFAMQGLGSYPIVLAGTAAQREEYLPPVLRGGSLAAFAITLRFPGATANAPGSAGSPTRLSVERHDLLQAAAGQPRSSPRKLVAPLFTEDVLFLVRAASPPQVETVAVPANAGVKVKKRSRPAPGAHVAGKPGSRSTPVPAFPNGPFAPTDNGVAPAPDIIEVRVLRGDTCSAIARRPAGGAASSTKWKPVCPVSATSASMRSTRRSAPAGS